MTTSPSTIDYLLDQLSSLPNVRARKMFGEYALYCDEKVVALVCDNQLFVKITPAGRELVGSLYEEGEAYPGAKPSMLIGVEFIEDHERLGELIRATSAALPAPKPKKPKVGKKKRPG
jgi:TfoX/Sxy family transcriptional regulator of competence genes